MSFLKWNMILHNQLYYISLSIGFIKKLHLYLIKRIICYHIPYKAAYDMSNEDLYLSPSIPALKFHIHHER